MWLLLKWSNFHACTAHTTIVPRMTPPKDALVVLFMVTSVEIGVTAVAVDFIYVPTRAGRVFTGIAVPPATLVSL